MWMCLGQQIKFFRIAEGRSLALVHRRDSEVCDGSGQVEEGVLW